MEHIPRSRSECVLNDSQGEGGSTYPQGVIHNLIERMVILPKQKHLAKDVFHFPKVLSGYIVPAHHPHILQGLAILESAFDHEYSHIIMRFRCDL